MCQSELDLRQLGTSVESLDSLEQMSHSKGNKKASIATTGSSTHEQGWVKNYKKSVFLLKSYWVTFCGILER